MSTALPATPTQPSRSAATLTKQLVAVGRMMRVSARYSPWEAFVWRRLAEHVDHEHFAQTGEILVDASALAVLMIPDASGMFPGNPLEIMEAFRTLEDKGHLHVVSHGGGKPAAYRLSLTPSFRSPAFSTF